MKRLILHNLDKWVPAFLSILSLMLVAGLSWQYDRQLDAIRVSKDLEISRLKEDIREIKIDNRERESRLRAEFAKEVFELRQAQEIETMKSQTLRERLYKKGWIE